jgi:hypothetical protein
MMKMTVLGAMVSQIYCLRWRPASWTTSFFAVLVVAVDGALAVDALPCVDDNGEVEEDSSCDEAEEAYPVDKVHLSCGDGALCRTTGCDEEALASLDTCGEGAVVDISKHLCSLRRKSLGEALLMMNSFPYFRYFSNSSVGFVSKKLQSNLATRANQINRGEANIMRPNEVRE